MSQAVDAALMAALDVKRDLTAHTAECIQRQKRLEEILGEIKLDVKGLRDNLQLDRGVMEKRVRSLEDDRTEAKGGWKYLLAAGAAGGAVMGGVIGVVTKVLPYLGGMIR